MHLWGKKYKRIPDEWRDAYLKRRSHQELLGDVCIAFDRIAELKLWNRVLTLVIGIEGAVIGWLATSLLDCFEAGHKLAKLLQ